jgi:hypothetical protein
MDTYKPTLFAFLKNFYKNKHTNQIIFDNMQPINMR